MNTTSNWEKNVRPHDCVNPKPDRPYSLVVIGAGTAGLVAENAGDLISANTLAMKNGIGLSKIGNAIQPCPTQPMRSVKLETNLGAPA